MASTSQIFNSLHIEHTLMGTELSLSLVEIIVLMLGAITLGITIHFFITSRKSLREATNEISGKTNKELGEWKSKYFNDTELRDNELAILRKQLAEIEENNNINQIEAEETRKLNKKLKQELEQLRQSAPVAKETAAAKPGYTEQLRLAQSSLIEHSQKINELLGQIDIVKETEEKQKEILKYNEELASEIDELRFKLSQKEKEVNNIRQKENLTKEMTSMLDNAYTEFSVLQEKIEKLENQVALSKRANIEYEDLKEGYQKLNRDYDELKRKYQSVTTEYRELKEILNDTEDELKEANHQRQQLQKKVAYLEELNNDMQTVADTHKKLEGQLKRIGELESMLNIITEEKEQLLHQREHRLKAG